MFVPFLTEDVARRVAASAVEDTGDLMRVFCLTTERPDGSTDTFWCYQPNYEIEEARGE